MAKRALLNTRIFSGGADLTGASNKVGLDRQHTDKPVTNFGSGGWAELLAGQASASFDGGGQWEAGDPSRVDDEMWAALGGIGALTVCPDTANPGDLAYLTQVMRGSYQLGGAVDDVAPWSAKMAGTWPLSRGLILHPPGTARTATGTGTAVQHVAVPAGKQLYAALHVLSVAGTATPTLTVSVQADNAVGFPSPAAALTFAPATAPGGQVVRGPGVAADDWYRVSYTITGTTPSFLFVVSLGVA